MVFPVVFLLGLAVLSSCQNIPVDGDYCPDDAEFLPCTCDMEGMNCHKALDADDLHRAFMASSNRHDIRALWVQGTNITELGPKAFGKFRFQNLYFDVNKIKHVDKTALEGMEEITYFISFFENKLETFPFQVIRKFKYLQKVNFISNQLSFIPDDSFDGSPLQMGFFDNNVIEKIGFRAFANLQGAVLISITGNKITSIESGTFGFPADRMQALDLSNNKISKIAANAFSGTAPVYIGLAGNQLVDLEENAFKPVIDSMKEQGQGTIDLRGNKFDCSGCEWSWIVDDAQELENFFHGLSCEDGRTLDELTHENINCNN